MLPDHLLEDAFVDATSFEESFFHDAAVKAAFQAARDAYHQRAELGDDLTLTGPTRAQCALSAFLERLDLRRRVSD